MDWSTPCGGLAFLIVRNGLPLWAGRARWETCEDLRTAVQRRAGDRVSMYGLSAIVRFCSFLYILIVVAVCAILYAVFGEDTI